MLHLACHGFVETEPGPPTAYLVLAGRRAADRGGAERADGRAPGRAIGLVVLAACHTGVAMSGYDEAYSLGTAFLAAGVRSVLSTQWSVPDEATSVLMFMFHHYLMVDGLPAWEALRQAQLWMLDEQRLIPERDAEATAAGPADRRRSPRRGRLGRLRRTWASEPVDDNPRRRNQ